MRRLCAVRHAFLLLALTCLFGCGKQEPAKSDADSQTSSEEDKASTKKNAPKLPDELAGTPVFDEDFVDPDAARNRRTVKRPYMKDPEAKVGTITIYCNVDEQSGGQKASRASPLQLDELISKPEPKEMDWFKNKIKPRAWNFRAWNYNLKKVMLCGVLGVIRNVPAGKLDPMGLTSFYSYKYCWTHAKNPSHVAGIFSKPIGPEDQPLLLGSWDPFDSQPVITDLNSKKVVWEGVVKKNEIKAHNLTAWSVVDEDGGSWTAGQWKSRALPIKSKPLPAGIYRVDCKRHKHQTALYAATDNPYYGVSSSSHRSEGALTIQNVPVGKHTVSLYHLFYETDTPALELEVKERGTTYGEAKFKLRAEYKNDFRFK